MPGLSDEYLYWLGFLLGDGSVTQHPTGTWRLKLTLSANDDGHLERFAGWFGGGYKIRYIEETGEVSVSVYNQDKIEDLIGMGVEPRKTETVQLPEASNDSPLIRGYSDADGYIGAPGGNGFKWAIASNSTDALEQIKNRVPVSGGEIVANETAGTNYLRYGKLEQADGIADFLYPDGADTEPAMARKRTPALRLASWSMKKTLTAPLEKYAE